MRWFLMILLASAAPAMAETVFAAHTIRAQSIISPADLVIKNVEVPGAVTSAEEIIGQEARVALYAGRPIRQADLGPPARVHRNQIVALIFESNGLRISAEGRALTRAGTGEIVRVMNLTSRTTVSGLVLDDGRILVSR